MAMYATPKLTPARRGLIEKIDARRTELGERIVPSESWVKSIRRSSQAAAWASSTRIEGFSTTRDRAIELLGDATPAGEDEFAFASYARAMQHVGVLATDKKFEWSRRVLLDLHFDACSFQRGARPGALREGPIFVTGPRGSTVFEGPPAEDLESLIDEFVNWIRSQRSHPLVVAAMAHLNLVSIHPFEDGNGRSSRIIQSLAIAVRGESAPEFGSIEEYLADHTSDYYAALHSAQLGKFDPRRSAGEWLDFCLEAHLAQAEHRLEVVGAAAERWSRMERLVESRGWPERLTIALEQAFAGVLTRSGYAREAEIAEPTASLDLRRLVDAGLVDVAGGGRSTHYVAAPSLKRAV